MYKDTKFIGVHELRLFCNGDGEIFEISGLQGTGMDDVVERKITVDELMRVLMSGMKLKITIEPAVGIFVREGRGFKSVDIKGRAYNEYDDDVRRAINKSNAEIWESHSDGKSFGWKRIN